MTSRTHTCWGRAYRGAAAVACALIACARSGQPPTASLPPAAVAELHFDVDHHVHILGPGLVHDWSSLGVTFSRPEAAYTSADTLLATSRPGSAATGRVVLVPMGHLYGNSEFREALALPIEEEARRVAAENDHVAAEAARHGERAVALCSVSVLRPYAWQELERCHGELASPGIKLHLASSEVDLREGEHLRRVAEVAAWAEREGLVVLLHLDSQRRGTQASDIQRFAEVVLAPHPRLVLVVAHLGGSGGYGPWTQSVFGTLVRWLAEVDPGGERPVRFDVSAVLLEHESEGVPASTAAEASALATDLRTAGFTRLVLGSDYPVFDPVRTLVALRDRAGLSEAELEALTSNRVPGLFDP